MGYRRPRATWCCSSAKGCIAGYYPEMNRPVTLADHDRKTGTPACKGIPVTIGADA